VQPDRLPQAPLHAIANYRATQHFAYGESNSLAFARAPAINVPAPKIKHGHVRAKMPPALLVHPFKVRMSKQAYTARELTPPAGA
jgi:hypothetical protein